MFSPYWQLTTTRHRSNFSGYTVRASLTACRDTRQAVEILKSGADDHLIKPTKEQGIKRLLILMHEKLVYRREVVRRSQEMAAP
jgi:FixJ family two-component response regulator